MEIIAAIRLAKRLYGAPSDREYYYYYYYYHYYYSLVIGAVSL
jgi:hypothetical protein